jgi:16S rRNA (adenine1518-N6/adenine1519-N6)-dimethyltransferase
LGQNFLVDRAAVRRIVDALDPGTGECVVEIGPGRGALTASLIDRAGRIVAIELDPRLAIELRERFSSRALCLLERDILRVDLESIAVEAGMPRASSLVVVGNLPYSISKPIAMKLVHQRAGIDRAVLMFQKEVADRLTATPGTKAYGPLTILTGLTYRITRLFELQPSAFRPRPKVDSTVTRWAPRKRPVLDEGLEAALRRCLAASFRHRRQTLRNNLRTAVGSAPAADALLESAALDGSLRPEAVPPEGFLRLAERWPG